MTFSDDDLSPISALQHLVYCRRQCMLIHAGQFWSENRWTAEGRLEHVGAKPSYDPEGPLIV